MIPRSEHPKPQFMREDWQCLNGKWQFEIDLTATGDAKKFFEKGKAFSKEITVPFCPESKLSGIENKDFMDAVWYKRTINIENTDKIIRLHFGAADYVTTLYVNGVLVGTHTGGYTSFFFDINDYVTEGENEICVWCYDRIRDHVNPRGKQSFAYFSHGCVYTRTTGIWQTVWLEYLPKNYVKSVKYYPNILDGSVTVRAFLNGKGDFAFKTAFNGTPTGEYSLKDACGEITFTVDLTEKHLWQLGEGNLYDVEITFNEDKVTSYFGLRQVRLDGMRFLLNERSVFHRLVLDQGFYPDGIYTAPTDEDLKKDIILSMNAGFNGARLHEKVFEERFLYYADKLGYMVWGEFADWGIDHTTPEAIHHFLPQWLEAVERDFNHPAIIGWCPLNEVWDLRDKIPYMKNVENIYLTTKAVDPTRPCIDVSGGFHKKTDIYCVHDYEQDPEVFRKNYEAFKESDELWDRRSFLNPAFKNRQQYKGEAVFVSEYGGIGYCLNQGAWGYGKGVDTPEKFYALFKGVTDVILDHPKMFGLCYTQLTDVEQEQNGIYYYDRTEKFDVKPIKEILSRKAKIEEE
jgi:beta-galactosidase/beta-glucuronidase